MPYCDTCDKYHTPSTLDADGRCPTCGQAVADDAVAAQDVGSIDEPEADRVPWHFKLLIAVLVGYVGFRIIEMITWLF